MNVKSRTVPIAAMALAAMSTIGCAYGMQRHPAAGMSKAAGYVSFFVVPGNASGNAELDRQINVEVVTALEDKGLVETPPEEAEAVIVIHSATPDKLSRDALYRGWGGWGWRAENTQTLNGTGTYKPGSLVVDAFDSFTKTLVWHSSTRDAVSIGAHSSDHALQKAVIRMFRDFPPAGEETVRRSADETSPAVAADRAMRIIFSPRPAFLVRIGGEPRYEDVAGTELQRITNTNAVIVRDDSGMHYLRLDGKWMESYDVEGSWSPAGSVPVGADTVLRDGTRERPDDSVAPASSHHATPDIVVSLTPAELVVTDGAPEYTPVDGGSLLRITNATATVFKEPTDKELYVHASSGWFRAWTTSGPWQQIADNDLPADLARVRTRTFTVQ